MRFVLCPRCELNYITDREQYCKVCLREMQGEKKVEEVELCSVCNEMPALPGRDVCALCLKEMNGDSSDTHGGDGDAEQPVNSSAIGEMDSVTSMDEIIPEMEEEIPSQEFGEIDQELSLESVREDEERRTDEEEEAENGDGDER